MFGRKLDTLSCLARSPEEEINVVSRYPVKSVVNLNENITIFIVHSNVDFKLIKQANVELSIEMLQQPRKFVKSNVAIASAITAYARIEMIKYKTLDDVKIYYTDTDSIFTDKELPSNMVGNEIGQMKDELDGGWIKEAYFLGVKKYAYIDNNDVLKTVFSGLPRNSLHWSEIIQLKDGLNIKKIFQINSSNLYLDLR